MLDALKAVLSKDFNTVAIGKDYGLLNPSHMGNIHCLAEMADVFIILLNTANGECSLPSSGAILDSRPNFSARIYRRPLQHYRMGLDDYSCCP